MRRKQDKSIYIDLKTYFLLLKDGHKELSPVKNPSPPAKHDLRKFPITPPLYFVLIEKIPLHKNSLFKTVVLTEEISLGQITKETPLFTSGKTTLVTLPLWIYTSEELFFRYSEKCRKLSGTEVTRILDYVEKASFPEDAVRQKYFESIIERLIPFQYRCSV